MLKRNTNIFLLLCLILIMTCDKDKPTEPIEDDKTDQTINEDAVFIDPVLTQITVTNVDSVSYVRPIYKLQFEGEIPDLKAGSVIVDTTGMGKIYVVTKQNLKKGTGIIDAFQGSIDFVIKNTELKVATPKNRTKQSTNEITNKLPMVSNEIYGKINDKEYHLPLGDIKLEYEKNFSNEIIWQDPSGNCSITITEGSVNFNPAIDYHAIYSNRELALSIIGATSSIGALDYLRLITYSDLDFNIKVNFYAEGSYDLVDKKVELVSYWHPIPIGPVVLSMKVSLNLNLDMKIGGAIDLSAGYEVKNNAVVGFEMPNGHFSTPIFYSEFNKIEENIKSPQLESDISFIERFEIIPDIEIYLYGLLGANGEIIPYQEFNINAHSVNDLVDWDCEFAVGLDGKVSLDLSAFHFDEATIEIIGIPFTGPRAVLYSAPHLAILSGDNQQGTAGQKLSDPFRVKAVDNFGNAVFLPVNVYWDVTKGGGELDKNNTNYKKSDGYAENYLKLGPNPGENKVSSYLKKANGAVHDENIFFATAIEDANTPPVASFTVNPSSGTVETSFQFDASGCTDNEDPTSSLQVRWDWENDGYWDANYSTTKTATHQYTSEGTKTIKMEVKDTGNLTATTTKQIIVGNINYDEMVYVAAGSFSMGSNSGNSEERPVHTVYLDAFYINKYEVTNVKYAAYLNEALAASEIQASSSTVMKDGNELLDLDARDCQISYSGGTFVVDSGKENYPVIEVSWWGAYYYAKHYGKRLPTEAEWEYAARGGSLSQDYTYSGSDNVGDVTWYLNNSGGGTHTVGTKQSNELGIYDMSGNVLEWCYDWHDFSYYSSSPTNNPQGPTIGVIRIYRGGSWHHDAFAARVAARGGNDPGHNSKRGGFRCVR